MDQKLDAVVRRLTADRQYRDAFAAAFGAEASVTNLARALASYVRTLRSGNSPADRYQAGEAMALDDEGREGLRLFRGKARCVECHMGPLLSDGGFHNTGVGWGGSDIGRMQVTGDPRDRGRFKTPSLRDVSLTAPYMHDGSISTLPEVVDFYDKGAHANSNLDPRIRPLALSALEKRQLVTYLGALTGER